MVKILLKIFFSGTKGPMTLGLGMQQWGLGPNSVCSNDVFGLTLTFLWQDQICFLKLGKIYIPSGKMLERNLMEETYNKWLEWQKVYVDIKLLIPWGLSAPALGLYRYIKHEKIWLKSDFKDIFWNLQQMGKVKEPAQGLYTCIKAWKNTYKIRLQRFFL